MKNLAFASLLLVAACHGSGGGNASNDSNSTSADANITQNSEELNASAANTETIDQYENESNASANSSMNQMGANVSGNVAIGGSGQSSS